MKLTLSLLIVVLMLSCKEKFAFDHITITSTGGVTGESISYEIRNDGQIFKINNRTNVRSVHGTIDKSEINRIYTLTSTLMEFDKERNEIGNMTRELIIKRGDEAFKTVWEPGMGSGMAVDMVYNSIYQSINKT